MKQSFESCVQLYEDNFGIYSMTECQKKVSPVLHQSDIFFDVVAAVGESEGKILSYGLPLLQKVDPAKPYTQALILTANRNEAINIFYILKPFAKKMGIEMLIINNGVSIADQIVRLRRQVPIVIATGSRLCEHIDRKTFEGENVVTFIVDKLEEVMKTDGKEVVNKCLAACAASASKWLFTQSDIDEETTALINEIAPSHEKIIVKTEEISLQGLRYFYLPVLANNKLSALISVIDGLPKDSKIAIITNSIHQSIDLTSFLKVNGYNALHINEENYKNEYSQNFIFVVSEEGTVLLNNMNCTHAIALYASRSLQECQKRALVCQANQQGPLLIEFVWKFDNDTIQSIKQTPSVSVQRFVFANAYESKCVKSSRLQDFMNTIESSECNLESINEWISTKDSNALQNITKSLINNMIEARVPFIESFQDKNVKESTLTVVFLSGKKDNLDETMVKTYIENIPYTHSQTISSCDIQEEKTKLVLKDINKDDFINFVSSNEINSLPFIIESIEEASNAPKREYSDRGNKKFSGKREYNNGYRNNRNSRYNNSSEENGNGGGGNGYRGKGGGGDYKKRNNYSSFGGGQKNYSGGSKYHKDDANGSDNYFDNKKEDRGNGGYSSGGERKFYKNNRNDSYRKYNNSDRYSGGDNRKYYNKSSSSSHFDSKVLTGGEENNNFENNSGSHDRGGYYKKNKFSSYGGNNKRYQKNDYGNRNKKYNNGGTDSSNKKSSFNVEDDFDFVD